MSYCPGGYNRCVSEIDSGRNAAPELILGPLQRFASETEATVWVETDRACEVSVLGQSTRTFCVAGHHYALVILEGVCAITFGEVTRELRAGDTFIVPADEVHQVVGLPDFTAIHVMPKDIRFNFKV